jgi:hypothetical protein
MSTTESDTDALNPSDKERPVEPAGSEVLFGAYSVVSPGVQIYIDGRPVSAPAND